MKHPRLSYCIKREKVKPKPTPEHDYSKDYFTIISLEDNNDIKWYRDSISGEPIPIEYSIDDGNTWTTYTPTTINQSVKLTTLNTGLKMLIRAVTEKWVIDSEGGFYGKPVSTKNVDIEGNIMSLLYGEDFVDKDALPNVLGGTFRYFFAFLGYHLDLEGLNIVSAKNLIMPATTLVRDCYNEMFQACLTLVEPPSILPATTLTEYCYADMFKNCARLTTAPELPATTLVNGCYYEMFIFCPVNHVKCLATNISASYATTNWLRFGSETGTFIKNSSMTNWTTGYSGIPNRWTIENAN